VRLGETPIFIIDTETTGIDASIHSVCEVGLVRWLPPNYTGPAERTEWSTLVKPRGSIPRDASAIHGITDADVANAPSISEALATVRRIVPAGALAVSHNLRFDSAFLDLQDRLQACTYRLSQRLWPQAPSHKNVELAKWLGGSLNGIVAHRALSDAKITAQIFHHLLRALVARDGALPSVEALVEWSTPEASFTHMPFGQHKGRQLEHVPSDYLEYALRKWTNAEPGLRSAIQRTLKARGH
jgi:DNA polymerase III epsilon subunit-like protein